MQITIKTLQNSVFKIESELDVDVANLKKKIEEQDFEGKGVFISKTQAIIDELMNSLDFNIAPELCSNLQQLYIYINERLTHANIKMEAEAMNEVIELLNTLRDGWKQALASDQDPTVKKLNDGES